MTEREAITCWVSDGFVKLQDVLDVIYERVDFTTYDLYSGLAVEFNQLPRQHLQEQSNAE